MVSRPSPGLPLAAWLLLASSGALAQAAGASETAAARRLFEEGLDALEQEDWSAAREAFARSYELTPRASTLLNLATAEAELGLLVEALESYRSFVEQATGRQRRHLRSARRAIADLERRLAHLELRVPDLLEGDVVQLDGVVLPPAALGVPLPLNPGQRHRLTVERGGERIGSAELFLVEGETRGVELALHPPPPRPPPIVEAPARPEEANGDEGLLVGIGVGAGVLALGAAIVLGVVLSQEGGGELYVGNLGPGAVTF